MDARFEILETAAMSAEQRGVADEVLRFSLRGLEGPFNMLLRSPKAAKRLMDLGDYLRSETPIPLELAELAILVHARCWNDDYEWAVHRPRACKAGITEEEADAIGRGLIPHFTDERRRAVFDFCVALCLDRQVPDAVFRRAKSLFGEQIVTDLTLLMGQYATVSMVISVSETKVSPDSDVPPMANIDGPPFRPA